MDHVTPYEAPPRSAVSHGVGLAGLAGLALWYGVAVRFGIDGPLAAMVAVAACGVPMVLWSLLVDRVHRNPSTGIDWSRPPRPPAETRAISLVKLAGLWTTWVAIAAFYCVGRWYWAPPYLFAMHMLAALAPVLLLLSVPYVVWLDRRLAEPRDALWHFGLLVIGRGGEADGAKIAAHLRAWAVKGFFTAFMIAIVPGNWADLIGRDFAAALHDPLAMVNGLVVAMFVIDVTFASVGYLLTMRPLDAHIRSANPYAAAWAAALVCYPPFVLMNGALNYHVGGREWQLWLDGHPLAIGAYGAILVLLTAGYAWATVAFGLRFSNLTDRGIVTHGPYRISKHPAYLAKNIFWWLVAIPFLPGTASLVDAIRNTVLLAGVSAIYWWRAKTEERHLSADSDYVAYAAWMARHGPVPRAIARLRAVAIGTPSIVPAE